MKLVNPISRITTRVKDFRCWKAGLVEFDLTLAKRISDKTYFVLFSRDL